jgi:signal transduction histidine kinase
MKKGRILNFILGAAQSLLIGTFLMISVYVAMNVSVTDDEGWTRGVYTMNLLEEEGSFDDSALFYDIFSDKLREIIRYTVISKQMETSGKFDPNKRINVSDYVHRRNMDGAKSIPGYFPLSDLLSYGETGLSMAEVRMDMEDFLTYFDERALSHLYYYVDDTGKLAYRGKVNDGLDGDAWTQLVTCYDETPYRERLLMAYKSVYTALEKYVTLLEQEDTLEVSFYVVTQMDEERSFQEEAYQFTQSDTGSKGTITIEIDSVEGEYNEIGLEEQAFMEKLYATEAEVLTDAMHKNRIKERYPALNAIPRLIDSVSNWTEYFTLQGYLQSAASELWSNYQEYSFYADAGFQETNLRYMVTTNYTYDGNIYTNETITNNKQVEEYFTELFPWYVSYPQDYAQNVGYDKWNRLLGTIIKDYRYAFTDDTKIWVAVDPAYPVTTDIFYRANVLNSFMRYREQILLLLLLLLVVWLILTVVIGIRTVKRPKEQTSFLDYLWTEVLLTMGAFLALGGYFAYRLITDSFAYNDFAPLPREYVLLLSGLVGILLNIVFYIFFTGLLRHGRQKALWKRSLTGQIIHWGIHSAHKCAVKVAESKNDMVRTLVPYGVFLLVNLAGVAVVFFFASYRYYFSGFARLGWEGFLIGVVLMVFDIGVGARLAAAAAKRRAISNGIRRIREGELSYQIDTQDLRGENKELAESINLIGECIRNAVDSSIKDERLKTELITNVSHDIKTPLTSIINYVDLLKREGNFQEPIKGYLAILDAKSQRLKQLTEDLVEASKISSGNYVLNFERLDFGELLNQALGEYAEKLEEKQLPVIFGEPEEAAVIYADSRRMWRVIENLLQNVCKYAMTHTRVYLHLWKEGTKIWMSLKNISLQPLNISASELTERFIRGDDSRTTEGSGLGLSIAKSLTEAQGGTFTIQLDGDLFKILMSFEAYDHS